ncbi:MAG TPA: PadR family transcriptional regulator [Aggregatilinea sp.]|jgi:DNA-binding PadR family transcriptional regulator|uniref:PadR family transcriptional regulator n=1 Tax=Aggregatilinea sp. TaxID=2806333 RepID=UPI002C1EFECA|nr:PadR family transcriptional regulator [Aggregatilinea sp.]HML23460.1 PadR family transcriptional regulator [Aggregatilinea sp.]
METIQEHLPLSESTFFILLSLAREPRHGYAILKDVEALSQRRVVLSTGTLYGALSRLLDHGWVIRLDTGEPEESGRPRKLYRLSDLGQRILQAETERMEHVAAAARLRFAEELS